MFRTSLTLSGLALGAMLLSTAAWADLSPNQVWEDWRQYMDSVGYGVTASEAEDQGVLTVSDIAITIPPAEGRGEVTMTLGSLRFEPAEDGAVAVVLPDTLPIGLAGQADDETPSFEMDLSLSQTDHAMIVSGSPEDMSYDYSAGTAALLMDRLVVDGDQVPDDRARIDLQATNFTSTTQVTVGEARAYTQDGAVEILSFDLLAYSPEDESKIGMRGKLDGLTINGRGSIPTQTDDDENMAALIDAGMEATGTIAYTSGMTEFDVRHPEDGDSTIVTSSSGGTLGVGMGGEGLSYEGSQTGTKISMQLADLPFPVELSMAESGFNLSVPVSAEEEPQDYAFGLTFQEFVMSDMIWGIFDPTGQLPRDPATLQLDVTGDATLQTDILDPEATAQLEAAPGEIETVKLNTLVLDAVGARLEGSGEVAFDNTDTTSYPGMSKPVGSFDLALAGGNALIDKLVAIGLLPDQQAMGARMMMGLFAVPGEDPDTLTSTIEFTQDGQVLANGQRIR